MNGTQILVECKYESYIYEYNGEISTDNITCMNGILDSVSIDCPDSPDPAVKADSCQKFKIKNGTVSRNQIGENFVFCDMGYTINIPKVAQDKSCNCSEGELVCFGGTKPVCNAETEFKYVVYKNLIGGMQEPVIILMLLFMGMMNTQQRLE